ncbi:helix-turn-helix transcriptional regulator [Dietzia maris]
MDTNRARPWTTREASEATGIPVGTLNYWRHVGTGPAYAKVGRKVLYDPATVWAWIDTRTTDPEAAA